MDFKDNKEVESLLQQINKDIKKELSEKRYQHSLGVMKKAEELAKRYKADVNKARLVGLAHDIAKEIPEEEKLIYAEQNGIEVDEIERINVGLLHAKIGADICKKQYGFTQDMQEAIQYHTTGNEKMDLLAKIIFVADKIEEGRDYKEEQKRKNLLEARKMALENIEEAVLYEIDASLVYTIQKKKLIHPDSIATRNKLLKNK